MRRTLTCLAAFMSSTVALVVSANAQPFEVDASIETSVEYLTGRVTLSTPGDFSSPLIIVDDIATSASIRVGTNYSFGSGIVGASYEYEEKVYAENDGFNQSTYVAEVYVTISPTDRTSLWTRYKSKNALPNGQLGDTYLDLVTSQLRLPKYQVGNLKAHLRPHVLLEWEALSSQKIKPLNHTGLYSELGFEVTPQTGPWRSEIYLAYGVIDSELVDFDNDYVDITWYHGTDLGARLPAPVFKSVNASVELALRREWYEGFGADDGSPRYDEVYEATFKVSKKIRKRTTVGVEFEVSDHISNWALADATETSTKVELEVAF